jgi:hypothetical protein
MKRFRCLVFGLGQVGRQACRSLLAEGSEIVAVYSRRSYVGDDLGSVLGQDPVGLAVQASAEFKAVQGQADIALFFTTSNLADLKLEAQQCLEQGINVLTIAEEGLYPWNHSPELAEELDEIARNGGATLVASGVNDVAMVHLAAVLGAFSKGVRKISVECTGDFGKFGDELLKTLPLGLDQAGYSAWLAAAAEGPHGASIAGQSLEALLALTDHRQQGDMLIDLQPTWCQGDVQIPSLGQTLTAGSSNGIVEVAQVTAHNGVQFEMRLLGKVFEAGDEEYLHVDLEAEQNLSLHVAPLPGVNTTASLTLNRIADVLAAPAGFYTTDRLPCAQLRAFDL